MAILSKDIKLLTLSLVLRTMPREQQTLLRAHFNPEVVKILDRIEQESKGDVEKLDWTPFYQAWPELQRILNDCKREIKNQQVFKVADEQRPKLRDYMLSKLGTQRKGPPPLLPKEILSVVDQYLQGLGKL